MSGHSEGPKGPDLTQGVPARSLEVGKPLAGRVGDEAVMLVRTEKELFAVGATCSHYGGPLADGLVEDDSVRCPWHHACFDLRTGEPKSPGLDDIPCFEVSNVAGLVRVGARKQKAPASRPPKSPASVVIVGAGPSGTACVEELRRRGYRGQVTLVGEEAPVDRPNLSKDFLAGSAPEEWLPLRTPDFFSSLDVELVTGDPAMSIQRDVRQVTLASGRVLGYGALLLATGAEPVKLPLEGAELPHVHLLRTLADSRSLIERARGVERAVVIGAGFIGLEVAASLRQRGLEVDVVAPDTMPLSKALGVELGQFVKQVHEAKGVRFHLGTLPKRITDTEVELDNGKRLPAGLVVVGVGVRPRTQLAQEAGLQVDNGILVSRRLQTNDPLIYAAGDVARYPDAQSGEPVRVEHWVHAGRMGQAAARSMLGVDGAFLDPPFFWSQHFDTVILRVGSGDGFDRVEVKGDLMKGDAIAAYRRQGRVVAVATVGRDGEALLAEVALAKGDAEALEKLLA